MNKNICKVLGAGLLALTFNSCDLDINQDPYAVTQLDYSQLLTAAEYEVAATFSEGYYLNANFSAYVHHTVSREIDNYALNSSYSTLGNTWSQAYRYALKNCDELISLGDANGNLIYAGIGRVLKVHTAMAMVDLWGDIPYSEFNVAGIETPKADKSEAIYNDLLKMINTAIANFKDAQAANTLKPSDNDLFYKGDKDKWLKAANTLKLKLLVQSRNAKDKITDWKKELDAVVAENNFIGDDEDLQFPHSTAKTPLDERKFGFVDEYEGTQKGVWISPWFYEILNGLTYNVKNNPMTGIKDPRVPYYYVNQITADAEAVNDTDYRDGAFVSIMMGSLSGKSSATQDASMTCIGIYPVGGKYDDGNGCQIGPNSGTGIAPDKMLQAYSVPFMMAELVLAGETAGDAKQYLTDGIKASFYHVNTVAQAAKGSAVVPEISAEAQTEFINDVCTAYDAASDERKMEIVMTQKWVANFYNPVEAYNDIRRTGYPKLFTGEGGKAYSPYAQTAAPEAKITEYEVAKILDYPRIMWYPNSEVDTNPNIKNTGRDVTKPTVFWDVVK